MIFYWLIYSRICDDMCGRSDVVHLYDAVYMHPPQHF